MPGHRPIARPESRERPFSSGRASAGGGTPSGGSVPRRGGGDPRLGPPVRCLSRDRVAGGRGGIGPPPARAAADSVAAREAGLRRLRHVAESHAEATQSWPEVRRELIDTLLHLRVLSLDVVDTIENWRRACGRQGAVWPDPQTGDNYLLKMKDDTRWLAESPLGDILRFSSKSDPFFVVPSTADGPQTPTNQMTPKLQAQRRSLRDGEVRRAVLPLQSSLLRRIRASELVIVKESVQMRVQQQANAASSATPICTPGVAQAAPAPAAHAAPAAAAVPAEPIASPQQSASLDAAAAAAAAYGQKQQLGSLAAAAREVAAEKPPQAPAAAAAPAAAPAAPAAVAPLAPPPAAAPGAPVSFKLVPVAATAADIGSVFNTYIARVDSKVARSMESLEGLLEALEDDGPEAPEWFWLVRGGGAAPTADTADGLCVFRLRRLSTVVGQLLHLSVTDFAWVEDALDVVKARMFAWQPIRSIRATLWYCDFDGEFQLYKDFEACFKKKRFRWFQLQNSKGVRGSVMNCKRFPPEPPDYPGDPETPAEVFGVEVCLGQAWLLGCPPTQPLTATRRLAGCPSSSLVVAAACLRQFWGQATAPAGGDAGGDGAAEGVAAEVAAKRRAEAGVGSAPEGSPAHLAAALARVLEAGPAGRAVPGVSCDVAAEDPVEMVRRGIGAQGFAEAVAALRVDALPDTVAALAPSEAVLGRLFVTLDWLSVRSREDGGFEVPVHSVGHCTLHSHPVFFVATTEDDTFVVVIPFQGRPAPCAEDLVFSKCTELIRNTSPLDVAPYKTLAFVEPFVCRSRPQTSELESPGALGVATAEGGSVHVAEFSTLSVGPGRPTPGRLPGAAPSGAGAFGGPRFDLRRPFAVCVFHTGIDDLNAPLTATLVE